MANLLNQAAVEALCSATYLEHYLDCLESLPDDLQRNMTQLRELDLQFNDLLKDIDYYRENYLKETEGSMKKRAVLQVQRALIKCQELGDEKLQIVAEIIEHIENRSRQLDQDLENLGFTAKVETKVDSPIVIKPVVEKEKVESPVVVVKPPKIVEEKEVPEKIMPGHKRHRRQRTHHDSVSKEEDQKDTEPEDSILLLPRRRKRRSQLWLHRPKTLSDQEEKEKPKKKKKRKAKNTNNKNTGGDKSPTIDLPIDPDEPLYCICQQVSFGEMIGCDNDNCEIEWFHFLCVALVNKPKGKWYCPNCRGDKSNVMRKDIKLALEQNRDNNKK
ncbi:inhibitor of growth protein 1-like isoform X1 [Tubulanus polymorphus]|uniref:inhibitor of growth protein 1-like isoform X1 n=1 Tax=Tubulanus polymorphus TaxID=672921 RepID=UPI003DA2B85D